MEDRNVGINLIIDGMSFSLTVLASEEPYYRKAARLLNDNIVLYKQQFGEAGVRVITMAALDIALKHVKQRDDVGLSETLHIINDLSHLLDDTLAKKG
ncbi:MAG: cell division protein ZapA [Bacteroidaceae bacterium]|nr:cell division protein ZapA [Bacteroidaceae bacterium]